MSPGAMGVEVGVGVASSGKQQAARRGEPAEGLMGTVVVVLDSPVLEDHLGFEDVDEVLSVEVLVSQESVEGVHEEGLPGDPGSMWAVWVPQIRHQSRSPVAVSSGPLSMRGCLGGPRSAGRRSTVTTTPRSRCCRRRRWRVLLG